MSWFDKLFGEDNESTDNYLNKRSQRRQKATQQEEHDSLLPQNNDVYERPKGKFRFPMRVLEEANDSLKTDDELNSDIASTSHKTSHDVHNDVSHGNAHHQQRRRRHMYDKTPTQNINSSDSVGQQSQQQDHYQTENETRTHKGKRMRIQTDVLRANASSKHKPTTSNFHHSDFKASEVPSAIFGTKKPRPLENGVIKRQDDSEEGTQAENETNHRNYNDESSQQKHQTVKDSDSNSTDIQNEAHMYHENSNDTAYDLSDNKERRDAQHVEENGEEVELNQPVTSQNKKDNTIKIENIYASQIVEEIRRERERKVLQKRQFKKALQQKRHDNQDKQEDSIQKAIDEMYAKQARNYIGESSLDEDGNAMNMSKSKTSTSRQSAENQQQTESTNSEDIEEDSNTPFNYEEVDLDHVRDVHTINNEQVNVNTKNDSSAIEANQNQVEQVTPNSDFENQNDENNTAIESSQSDMSENERTYILEKSFERYLDENDVDDAQYRELSETDPKSKESLAFDSLDSQSENEQLSESLSQPDHGFENSESDIIDNHVTSNDAAPSEASQLESDESMNENESLNVQNEILDERSELGQSDSTDNNNGNHIKQPDETKTYKKATSIKKGSKPFNVVMTPSDKKRMLDAQKEKNKSNIQLNNVDNFKHNTSSDISDKQSQSNNDQLANEPASESLTVTDDNQNETNLSHDLIDEQSDFKPETDASSYSDDYNRNDSTQSNVQQESVESAESDMTNVPSEQNENHKQNVQEPVLKPETSGNQLGGLKTPTEDDNKATIRRGPNIKLPSIELLEAPKQHEIDNAWIEDKKQELNEAFYYFNVPAEVQNVTEGPSVTRFELSVEKGVKVSRITALQDDIKMALAAKDIRIEAPIPGTSLVGIEVPNQNATTVNLRSILEEPAFKNAESKLTVAMGLRINNEPLLMDISKTPHALIAGATGSGKSVCINSILMSLLYKNHPEELRLLLIDPKMVELAPYNDLPHLVAPVITDVKAATQSLKWAVEEMERRYKVFAKYHVRNITAFNKKATYEDRMPKIVIVIDELADLMMMAPQEVEQSIARIAQKARACGIHMLVATQRPSVNVITGLIKANIPTRIAFMVSSSVDSRTILDSGGAERLLGYGDMLYLGSGMNKPIRVQGTFVSDEEIDDVVDFIKQQRDPEYLFEEKELLKKTESQPQDDLFDDVCRFMLNEGHISTSLVQRHFQIGYNRAARIIDQLEQLGYVSGANGSKPRDVYITESDLNEN
ncbi:DNA translocase FtsK [Staphylococcus sp. GDY8P156P]|uniref:DNA translocase FtsK n=1 Tax=Staphylococcus sp. GDY8P156P TaxID=2804165 RepID=UPI001AEC3D4C|nr:DNA translocase FtsK [Staphylococcus sp. GDY8P156P]